MLARPGGRGHGGGAEGLVGTGEGPGGPGYGWGVRGAWLGWGAGQGARHAGRDGQPTTEPTVWAGMSSLRQLA